MRKAVEGIEKGGPHVRALDAPAQPARNLALAFHGNDKDAARQWLAEQGRRAARLLREPGLWAAVESLAAQLTPSARLQGPAAEKSIAEAVQRGERVRRPQPSARGRSTMHDKEVHVFVPTKFLPNAHDPLKGPSWRWQRSGYLLDHGRRPLPSSDDALTRAAWAFRGAQARCSDDADRERLASEYPALAEANAAHTREPLRRAELEARLLTGADDKSIAETMGLSPAGVAAYHDVHFEVRPHLKAPVYILGVVLGG